MVKEFGGKEEAETKYHGGFLYIGRLDKLFAGLDQITLERDLEKDTIDILKKNFSVLKALYKELESKMDDKDKERQKKVNTTVTGQYRLALKSYNRNRQFKVDIFDLFDEWEIELRRITEKKGLLMPDKEEDIGL